MYFERPKERAFFLVGFCLVLSYFVRNIKCLLIVESPKRRCSMSTLETAICFTLILVLLTFMITGPEAIALDSFECAKDGGNELFYMEQDKNVMYRNIVHGANCYDTSPERLCTYLTGISENFRLIYGSVLDLSKEAGNEED